MKEKPKKPLWQTLIAWGLDITIIIMLIFTIYQNYQGAKTVENQCQDFIQYMNERQRGLTQTEYEDWTTLNITIKEKKEETTWNQSQNTKQ